MTYDGERTPNQWCCVIELKFSSSGLVPILMELEQNWFHFKNSAAYGN